MKISVKYLIFISLVLMLSTCIDPYTPELKGYDSLLVVEGQLTNENVSCEIKLSRTGQTQNSITSNVSDAVVFISDESNNKAILQNIGDGLYKTDSANFTGKVGKTYSLDIKTSDGKEYMSEPCLMRPVPEINSIYYERGVGYTNNQSEIHEGINLFLDSKDGDEINSYFRWAFEETWKFGLPAVKRFVYVNEKTIIPLNNVKEFCWKQKNSTDILIQSFSAQQAGLIKSIPLTFIASDLSDRLTIQYSILAKQYSISEKEFKFWSDLKKVNENTGDIFGSQPFYVTGNISNVQDKNEKVLGYFQVSAVSKKRRDITFRELLKLNLPLYHYACKTYATSPGDYCQPGVFGCVPPTWDELNWMWTYVGYVFLGALIDPDTKDLLKLYYTTPVCSDCELTGNIVKPAFWTDLN